MMDEKDWFLREIIKMRKPREHGHLVEEEDAGILRLYKGIAKFFGEIDMELFVCDTYAKESCTITSEQGTVLLYDKYLTGTLNVLNLLYFQDGCPEDVRKYCCRLMAESYFSLGRYEGALFMVSQYVERPGYHMHKTGDERDRRAAGCAAMQQFMVISHEIGHWFLQGRDDRKEILESQKKFLGEIFQYGSDGIMKRKFRQEIWDKDTIAEECFCDYVAVQVLLEMFLDSCPIHSIMEAAFLTSQHLEVLAAVEAFVEEGKYRRTDNLLQSAVRMVYLRFVLTELVADIIGGGRKQEIFHELGEIYEGYRSMVYHPATEVITEVGPECSEFMFRTEGSVTKEMVDGLIGQLI